MNMFTMASYRYVSKLTTLIFLCTCFLATGHAQTATDPGTMPSPVGGNPGPPAVPNVVKPQNGGWYGIKQWTSLGDSYATGVGVGTSLAWNRCVHFSDAYPLLMNADDRMPGQWGNQRQLWDCTCSGATTQYVSPSTPRVRCVRLVAIPALHLPSPNEYRTM